MFIYYRLMEGKKLFGQANKCRIKYLKNMKKRVRKSNNPILAFIATYVTYATNFITISQKPIPPYKLKKMDDHAYT